MKRRVQTAEKISTYILVSPYSPLLPPAILVLLRSTRRPPAGEERGVRDEDVRGEQTQGYEAKRVRGMKGVSHSRYVHSTCLSSL